MPTLQSEKVYEAAFKVTYDLLSGGNAEMLDPAQVSRGQRGV
jgi:hypothetical protein